MMVEGAPHGKLTGMVLVHAKARLLWHCAVIQCCSHLARCHPEISQANQMEGAEVSSH